MEDPAIIRLNREHFRSLLAIARDRTRREIIVRLLAQEDAKLSELGLADAPEREDAERQPLEDAIAETSSLG
jgi:hypothetical protein